MTDDEWQMTPSHDINLEMDVQDASAKSRHDTYLKFCMRSSANKRQLEGTLQILT